MNRPADSQVTTEQGEHHLALLLLFPGPSRSEPAPESAPDRGPARPSRNLWARGIPPCRRPTNAIAYRWRDSPDPARSIHMASFADVGRADGHWLAAYLQSRRRSGGRAASSTCACLSFPPARSDPLTISRSCPGAAEDLPYAGARRLIWRTTAALLRRIAQESTFCSRGLAATPDPISRTQKGQRRSTQCSASVLHGARASPACCC